MSPLCPFPSLSWGDLGTGWTTSLSNIWFYTLLSSIRGYLPLNMLNQPPPNCQADTGLSGPPACPSSQGHHLRAPQVSLFWGGSLPLLLVSSVLEVTLLVNSEEPVEVKVVLWTPGPEGLVTHLFRHSSL